MATILHECKWLPLHIAVVRERSPPVLSLMKSESVLKDVAVEPSLCVCILACFPACSLQPACSSQSPTLEPLLGPRWVELCIYILLPSNSEEVQELPQNSRNGGSVCTTNWCGQFGRCGRHVNRV